MTYIVYSLYYYFNYIKEIGYLDCKKKIICMYISGNQDGGALVVYCFRTLKIIFVAILPSFVRTKFDKKHVLME